MLPGEVDEIYQKQDTRPVRQVLLEGNAAVRTAALPSKQIGIIETLLFIGSDRENNTTEDCVENPRG